MAVLSCAGAAAAWLVVASPAACAVLDDVQTSVAAAVSSDNPLLIMFCRFILVGNNPSFGL